MTGPAPGEALHLASKLEVKSGMSLGLLRRHHVLLLAVSGAKLVLGHIGRFRGPNAVGKLSEA